MDAVDSIKVFFIISSYSVYDIDAAGEGSGAGAGCFCHLFRSPNLSFCNLVSSMPIVFVYIYIYLTHTHPLIL